MNRGELRTAALDALNRKSLTTVANTWITSATTRINTTLRHRAMLAHKVLPVTGRVFAAPADFIEAETARLNREPGGGEIVTGAPVGELVYAPPSEITGMAANASRASLAPKYFTTHGLQFELAPWRAEREYQMDLWYYRKLSLLNVDSATNFFLTEFPHVYLNAVMAFGHRFLLEHDTALGYEAIFGAEIQAINDAEAAAKHGNGPLIVRPPSRRIGGRFS